MPKLLSEDAVAAYRECGYHFPIEALSESEVAGFRRKLEDYEAESGGPIKAEMRHRSHVLFSWIDEMVRHPKILDAMEDLLGPDILCWNTSFFIKEARDPGQLRDQRATHAQCAANRLERGAHRLNVLEHLPADREVELLLAVQRPGDVVHDRLVVGAGRSLRELARRAVEPDVQRARRPRIRRQRRGATRPTSRIRTPSHRAGASGATKHVLHPVPIPRR